MNKTTPVNLIKTTAYNEQLLSSIRRERNLLNKQDLSISDSLPLYTVYEEQVSNLLPYLDLKVETTDGGYLLYKIHFRNYHCYLAVILDKTKPSSSFIRGLSISQLNSKRIAKANRQWANPDRNKTRGLANRAILNSVFASITDRIKRAGLEHLLFKGHSFGWADR